MPSWMEVLRSHESHSNSREFTTNAAPHHPCPWRHPTPQTQPGGYPMAGFDTEKCCTWSSKLIHPDEVYVSIYSIYIYITQKNPHPTFRYAQPKIFEPPLRPIVSRWLKWNHTYHTFFWSKSSFTKEAAFPVLNTFNHFLSNRKAQRSKLSTLW